MLNISEVLNDQLGYVVPVIYRIQKDNMGLHGKKIPHELRDQFVEGMIKLCRSEFEMDFDDPSYEIKLHRFVEANSD
ncbi:MAG: hypothetical protein ACQEQM_04615 [Thermoplasmatota archaeon]